MFSGTVPLCAFKAVCCKERPALLYCRYILKITEEDTMTEVVKLCDKIWRIRCPRGHARESLLTKYRVLNVQPEGEGVVEYRGGNAFAEVSGKDYSLRFTLEAGEDGGFSVRLPLVPEDRLFGLGDESRDCVEKHGVIAQMKQENVRSYGPVPFLMSSRGWAVLVNCTYAHTFDIAASDPGELHIYGSKGALDIFVFTGTDLREALYLAGKVAGRPVMLPKPAYGLTFVMNEDANARSLLDDALRFKERGIPCDIFGLEPSWMSKHYDSTTEKKWDSNRFYIPHWQPENYYGSWSFIWNLHRMGKALSLWLCCDYDLFWKEENDVQKNETRNYADAEINDPHLQKGIRMDKVTKGGEPWFEHLKKFVDNGAEAFKLDGAYQVIPFPDRLWAGRYTDDEIRNLYPVIYARQMQEGFRDHTGRRAMIYTAGMYAGIQQYAATWAGDTGCNVGVLLSLMNFAMCGHSNTSFDMTCDAVEKIHFGFLAPWAQHQGWANWLYPWYGEKSTEESYRWYSQLRSRLFPYLYAFAHEANETSMPVLRPLPLAYPQDDAYDKVFNEYMLGDSLLVSVFEKDLVLPEEDGWYDFYTGRLWDGPAKCTYTPPAGRGGALFVKAGSVIVMQPWADSLRDSKPGELTVHVWPGKDAAFTLWEDDYSTYGYEKGEAAKTEFRLEGDTLVIGQRTGGYPGMSDVTAFRVVWHGPDGSEHIGTVSAETHRKGEVRLGKGESK